MIQEPIREAAGEPGRDTSREAEQDYRQLLAARGPMAVLSALNQRTRFRFTGIYRADPPYLRNLLLFDRENPLLNVSGEVCPLEETYCALVCRSGHEFGTRNAPRDERLVAHAAREKVISYFGVPIRRASGQLWGTLCHFDVRPRLVPSQEIPVLEDAAFVIAAWLDAAQPLS